MKWVDEAMRAVVWRHNRIEFPFLFSRGFVLLFSFGCLCQIEVGAAAAAAAAASSSGLIHFHVDLGDCWISRQVSFWLN